jgi:chromosome partitioning protein
LKTLVVDLDAQCNSTRYLLGAAADEPHDTLAEFFDQTLKFTLRSKSTAEFITETRFENLHLLASSPQLDELHGKLESRYKIYKLREALEAVAPHFDRIYIDTPPALNFYTRSALIAGGGCLIPFDCDAFSRRALDALLENIQEIRADHNAQLRVDGIVVNQYQPRANLPQQLVQQLLDEGLPVLQPYLSASVKIRESHQRAQPMVHLDPKHKLTQEFQRLHEALPA